MLQTSTTWIVPKLSGFDTQARAFPKIEVGGRTLSSSSLVFSSSPLLLSTGQAIAWSFQLFLSRIFFSSFICCFARSKDAVNLEIKSKKSKIVYSDLVGPGSVLLSQIGSGSVSSEAS